MPKPPVHGGMKALRTALLLTTAGLLTTAYAQIDVNIRLGHAAPPPPPDVVVIQPAGPAGPPPWSHGHWFHRSRAYYYYPESDVYYRPADHMWFYEDGNVWRTSPVLPARVRIDFGRCVTLHMETDRPYRYHRQVVTYYPPRYFYTRVRIKERPGRHDWDHHDHDDHQAWSHHDDDHNHDDHRDHGHGPDRDHDRH
jgi:hypothetical protein